MLLESIVAAMLLESEEDETSPLPINPPDFGVQGNMWYSHVFQHPF